MVPVIRGNITNPEVGETWEEVRVINTCILSQWSLGKFRINYGSSSKTYHDQSWKSGPRAAQANRTQPECRKKMGPFSPPQPSRLCSALMAESLLGSWQARLPEQNHKAEWDISSWEIITKHPANACSQGVWLCWEETDWVSQKLSLLKRHWEINHPSDLFSFPAWELQL